MNEQRALELLKKGLTTGQVASVIGVSPGRISQFLQKEEVKQALEVARAESDTKDIEEVQIQAKTVAVKNVILDALAKRTDEASYMDLARALEMISRAESIKQNPIPLSGGPIFNHAQVVITMPDRVIQQEIQITQDREVIAIGNRALAPMPASRVTKLFEEMKNERASLPAESKESSATVIQA